MPAAGRRGVVLLLGLAPGAALAGGDPADDHDADEPADDGAVDPDNGEEQGGAYQDEEEPGGELADARCR